MPTHDWTRVDAGVFHHFNQAWTVEITNALNGGSLPDDYLQWQGKSSVARYPML
jgi:hypothetical protein